MKLLTLQLRFIQIINIFIRFTTIMRGVITMSEFCDGELYRKHSLFSVDRQALQVLLYNDDIEICNPLGSRAKIHKVCNT